MLVAPTPNDGDDDETSLSLTPSLSLLLPGGLNLDESRSDTREPPSCEEDELIRGLSSLVPSLPERRLAGDEEVRVCVTGLVILNEDDANVEGEVTSDTVLPLDVFIVTRVDDLETPPGSLMVVVVVVDGFWSNRENTEDTVFSLCGSMRPTYLIQKHTN